MKRLTLDMEALEVESFDTADGGDARRGTVRAHGLTEPDWETCGTCDPRLTVCGGVSYCVSCAPETSTCPYTEETVDDICW